MEKEFVSEGTFADLIALTEHGGIPTKLELDRFIRGQGYHKVEPYAKTAKKEQVEEDGKIIQEMTEALKELVAAMHKYESEFDVEAPWSHIHMRSRANNALAKGQAFLKSKGVKI